MADPPTLRNLISRGYLPKELPKCFTSVRLGEYVGPALANAHKTPSSWLGLSLARSGRIRRPLAIPNPREQLRLAELIVQNWNELDFAMRRDRISLSVAVPDRDLKRGVAPSRGFDIKPIQRVRSRRYASHLIRADISRFYGSIYSHSLEWVELGKEAARAAIAAGIPPNGWGAQIDSAVRSCNENQTIGLPVGPDTSLVLSEAVLSTALAPLSLDKASAWRYSDDLEIAAESAAQADEMLGQLEMSLAQFHLALNPLKSTVIELPDAFTDSRIAGLRTQRLRLASPREFRNDAIELMSSAHEAAEASDETVSYVKFALGRIGREFWSAATDWATGPTLRAFNTILSMHLGSVRTEPSVFPLLDLLLHESSKRRMPVPTDEIQHTLDIAVRHRAPRNHSYEVVWAIYIATRLGVELSAESARLLNESSDAMIQTIAMAALHWGSIPAGSTGNHETADRDPAAPTSDVWLLGYQAWRFGLTAGAHFRADPFFKRLDELEIDFLVMPPPYQAVGRKPVTGATVTSDRNDVPFDDRAVSVDHGSEPDSTGVEPTTTADQPTVVEGGEHKSHHPEPESACQESGSATEPDEIGDVVDLGVSDNLLDEFGISN